MADLTPFIAGIEAARKSQNFGYSDDPRSDFYAELINSGYKPDGQIILGRVIRIQDPTDKIHKKTGWYFYNEIEVNSNIIGFGTYGSWKDNEKITWSSKSQSSMNFEESMRYRDEMEKARRMREESLLEIQNEAALKAADLYNSASIIENHPYLDKKGIKCPLGIKSKDDYLIVPITNEDMKIISTQKIYPDGFKKNQTGGKMKGGFFLIEGATDRFCVCEGVATGQSIFEATGASVFCAMSASNIYEVAGIAKKKYQNSIGIICADDNSANKVNTGLNAAMQAGEAFGFQVASPTTPKDFNDMHQAQGLDAIKSLIFPEYKVYQEKAKEQNNDDLIIPDGFIRDCYDYYNATSGNDEKGYALQTSLSIASVIISRWFTTTEVNFSSLFFLNLGRTGTGKEHIKTTIDAVLEETGLDYLISGDGYTSSPAVISALISKPRHITFIDEFDKHIESAKNKYGSSQLMESNSKLVEAWGRLHGSIRGKSYSTIGLAKDKAEQLNNIVVKNPAITLVANSTPDNFMKNVGGKEISDGFLNRFIIYFSEAKEDIRRHKKRLPVPERIKTWVTAIENRRNFQQDNPTESPSFISIDIENDAMEIQYDFQIELIQFREKVSAIGLADMSRRTNEIAMRLAMICALSENPNTSLVELRHMKWGIYWARKTMHNIVEKMKMSISGSEFEAEKKEILGAIRKEGEKGVTWVFMQKRTPFSKYKPKDLREILKALVDADLIIEEPIQNGGRGRPTIIYKAIEE